MTRPTLSEELKSAGLARFGFEFVWIALGLSLAIAGGAVGIRVLTGVLSPSTYGELTLAMTLSTLTHQSILGPLGQAFLRFFASSHESHRLSAYLLGVRHLLLRATAIVLGIALVATLLAVVLGQTDWIGLVWGALFLSLVYGIGASLDGIQNAAREQAVVAWHQGATPWSRFAFAFWMVMRFGAKAGVALVGYILGSALILASQTWLFWRKILSTRPRNPVVPGEVVDTVRQMLAYAWPIATWGVITWFQMSSDRWALQIFRGAESVGIYAVLYQLGYVPMTMVANLVVQLVVPVIFSRSGDGKDPHRLQSAHMLNMWVIIGMVVATSVLTLMALLLRDPLFALLVGPQYHSGSTYLPLVVLAGGLFACGQCASLVLMSGTNTRLLVRPKIVTAVVGVLFNLIGAYWFGVPGVVMANVLFGALFFGWVVILAWKQRDGTRTAAELSDRKIPVLPLS